jgi:glycosidase
MCIGGVPSVYYGDEQGFRGLKEHREGGDDAIRPAFPAVPADLPPDGWRYYRLHQRLIGFRRRHPWLARARTEAAHLEQTALALGSRGERDGEQALLLLNVGDAEFRFAVDTAGLAVAERSETAEGGADLADLADPLLVPPHGWTILA